MQAARRFNSSTNNHFAFANSKNVISDISNAIRGSDVQWRRGRSFVASVPSDSSSESQRGGKRVRVSKDERRAMLESFVDKYRALNAGKYPTPSAAKKQVGGSYYVVKNILQELEYNSRVATSSMGDEGALVKDVQKRKSQSKVEVAASSELIGKLTCNLSMREMDESRKGVSKQNESSDTKRGVESISIVSSVHQTDSGSKELSPACKEDSIQEASESQGSSDLNDPRGKVTNSLTGDDMQETGKEAPVPDKHGREMAGMQNKEHESSTRSTMWGNLKSFADGIINLWRKM